VTTEPTIRYPLGRLLEHDERSRNFPARAVAPQRIKPVLWRKYGTTLDQGTLGSCTGNAAAHAMNCNPYRENARRVAGGRLLLEKDAVSIYTDATIIDPFPGTYPPEDTGSSGLAVAKVLRNRGYIDGYSHAFTPEQARGALQLGPCLFGIWWHESMFEPDQQGYVHPDGRKAGGHEILLIGDDGRNKITAQNSWGSRWGAPGGRFHMTYDVFADLMLDDGDVTALRPKTGA
jgi:hypothetical protein